jgi:hypothetical protein
MHLFEVALGRWAHPASVSRMSSVQANHIYRNLSRWQLNIAAKNGATNAEPSPFAQVLAEVAGTPRCVQ